MSRGSSPPSDPGGNGRALLDRLGCLEAADASAAAMLGFGGADALGHCLWDRFPALRGGALQQGCAAVLDGAGPQHFLFHHGTLDRWYVVLAEPIGSMWQPRAVELRFTDVTDLPGGIGARIRAERLDAVAQALGPMSHDVNNCLTIIMGNADYLEEVLAGAPEAVHAARLIVSAGERLSALTGRVLGFVRRYPRKEAELDAGEVIERVVEGLRGDGPSRIRIRARPGLPFVMTHAGDLEAALLELVRNAMEATPAEGSIEIVAEAVMGEERVRVTVADTGTGMEAALLKRCVEPFVTARSERCGAGLGLSHAYAFAVANGGALHLESWPGRGTRATLDLPAVPRPRSESMERAPSTASAGQALLVEDDPQGRAGIARLLRSLGYGVTESGSAAEALGILRGGSSLSLLLADVILPGGQDGASLVRDARRLRPGLPALLMSGYVARDAGGCGGDGDTPLLAKPFRKGDLEAALRGCIAPATAMGAARRLVP